MQACPYDALYIDPNNHTAAKCNFCSHRVDRGLQPACVVACPEQAIVTGDLEDAGSFISKLIASEPVQVRRPEKGTAPSLYYIDGDHSALDPQATGETVRCTATDVPGGTPQDVRPLEGLGVAGFLGGGNDSGRRVYDAPKNSMLWGWEVSAYLSTKALAAGVIALPLALALLGHSVADRMLDAAAVLSLLMQAATGALLVADLERPGRFLNVLLRGNPRSWLVRGAWILTAFGAATTGLLVARWTGLDGVAAVCGILLLVLAIPVAVYTAFLLAQAKGRDLWQSPLQPVHMLVHAAVAGAAGCLLLEPFVGPSPAVSGAAVGLLVAGLLIDLGLVAAEITMPHATRAAAAGARHLHTGRAAIPFWAGLVGGSLLSVLLVGPLGMGPAGALLALAVLFVRNDLWVRAPQLVPIS
jgi:formate-dependent nitrite reductase membrane component NrfD